MAKTIFEAMKISHGKILKVLVLLFVGLFFLTSSLWAEGLRSSRAYRPMQQLQEKLKESRESLESFRKQNNPRKRSIKKDNRAASVMANQRRLPKSLVSQPIISRQTGLRNSLGASFARINSPSVNRNNQMSGVPRVSLSLAHNRRTAMAGNLSSSFRKQNLLSQRIAGTMVRPAIPRRTRVDLMGQERRMSGVLSKTMAGTQLSSRRSFANISRASGILSNSRLSRPQNMQQLASRRNRVAQASARMGLVPRLEEPSRRLGPRSSRSPVINSSAQIQDRVSRPSSAKAEFLNRITRPIRRYQARLPKSSPYKPFTLPAQNRQRQPFNLPLPSRSLPMDRNPANSSHNDSSNNMRPQSNKSHTSHLPASVFALSLFGHFPASSKRKIDKAISGSARRIINGIGSILSARAPNIEQVNERCLAFVHPVGTEVNSTNGAANLPSKRQNAGFLFSGEKFLRSRQLKRGLFCDVLPDLSGNYNTPANTKTPAGVGHSSSVIGHGNNNDPKPMTHDPIAAGNYNVVAQFTCTRKGIGQGYKGRNVQSRG